MNFELRIPWKVQTAAYSIYQHGCSQLSQLASRKKSDLQISFYCNYHQITGSTVAISCIANHISRKHHVDAFIKPLSGYSRLLDLSVAQHFSADKLAGNPIFVDIEQENKVVNDLIADNRKVILSCHAFPATLHSVAETVLRKNLELATYIHFVSDFQRSEFIRYFPDINMESKSFVIPNYTRKSTKQYATGNIGIIGHLNRDVKNAIKGIQLGQQSNARLVQCWGSDTVAGLDDPATYTKLRINGWSNNILKVHKSFDVLISASQSETFGLVVVEALSAGIPCLISDIPVFRELFSNCKGVIFMTGDDPTDIQSINHLLDQASTLNRSIIEFWESHFSNEIISTTWFNRLSQINESP